MKKMCIILGLLLTIPITNSFANIMKSTIDDQTGVEVTVYNSNLGLIKDVRRIDLDKGVGELRFMDVAAHIRPETVHVKSLSYPEAFSVLEQNYEYDLMDRHKLLDKFVGKDIKLLQENEYKDVSYEIEAKLLSYNNNSPIYQIGDEIYLGFNGHPILPEIPENLIAKPTLTWMYQYAGSGANDVEVSYLTNNINWKADYILVLNKADDQGDLSGWVTMDNRSGTTYQDATLKLVAGDVNRVHDAPMMKKRGMIMAAQAMDFAEEAFTEQAFFEYHIYDLQRKATLKNNQKKQISLLNASEFGVKKELRVYGNQSHYMYQYRPGTPKQKVEVYVMFENSKDNGLGMPLPKGVVRLYKKDHQDKMQFIGEDHVDHTPKDEEVSLRVGEAFDVVAERKQTNYRKIHSQRHESSWEIKLKNRKEEDIVVTVIEPLYGSWEMMDASHEYTKTDAFTIRFDVPVKKDEEVTVRYRVQVGLKDDPKYPNKARSW